MLVSRILIISFLFQYEFSFFLFFRREIEHFYIKKKILVISNRFTPKKKRLWLEFINYQGIQLFWTWNNFSKLLSYILWHDYNSFLRNWDGQNAHTQKNKGKNQRKYPNICNYYLIFVPCKTAALHGTGIEISSVIKFTQRLVAMNAVQNWWKSTAQGQNLVTRAIYSDTVGTLLSNTGSVS